MMVNFMKAHPDLARCVGTKSKADFDELWETLTKELNLVGPPKKTSNGWKKSWSDWKASIKKRINAKRTDPSLSEHIYMVKLTKAEDTIATLCKLYEPGEDNCCSSYSMQDYSSVSNYGDGSHLILEEETGKVTTNTPMHSTEEVKHSDNDNRKNCISPDTSKYSNEALGDVPKCLDEVSRNAENLAGFPDIMKSIADSLDGWCILYAEQNRETIRHNKVIENLMREKISIKMRSLELQELQYKMKKEKKHKKAPRRKK